MIDMMEQITRIAGVNPRKCMRCGKCSGACPAYDEMEYHPHQFVSMVENGRIDELMRSKGIYTCLSCFACVTVTTATSSSAPRMRRPSLTLSSTSCAATSSFLSPSTRSRTSSATRCARASDSCAVASSS